MTALLVVLVILLFSVSLWQLNKLFILSKQGLKTGEHPGIATDKDNKSNGYLMLAFVIFIYALVIFTFYRWGITLLPESASEHGVEIDNLFLASWIVIFTVGIIMQGLLHYFAFKYRGEEGKKALFYFDNSRLEFIWTIIPVIVLSGLIIYGLFTWVDVMNVSKDDDPMVVELYAYQFGWRARYAGDDNELGKANVRLIEGVNQLGVDTSDPYSKDDFITDVLYLPVNKKVLIKMRSQDVLHSAYMPHFRAQMNVVPGMVTQFAFTPTITTQEMRESDRMIKKVDNINRIRENKSLDLMALGNEGLDPYEFDYLILCNKICGNNHYNMQMKIVVVEEDEFNDWTAEQTRLEESLNI